MARPQGVEPADASLMATVTPETVPTLDMPALRRVAAALEVEFAGVKRGALEAAIIDALVEGGGAQVGTVDAATPSLANVRPEGTEPAPTAAPEPVAEPPAPAPAPAAPQAKAGPGPERIVYYTRAKKRQLIADPGVMETFDRVHQVENPGRAVDYIEFKPCGNLGRYIVEHPESDTIRLRDGSHVLVRDYIEGTEDYRQKNIWPETESRADRKALLKAQIAAIEAQERGEPVPDAVARRIAAAQGLLPQQGARAGANIVRGPRTSATAAPMQQTGPPARPGAATPATHGFLANIEGMGSNMDAVLAAGIRQEAYEKATEG